MDLIKDYLIHSYLYYKRSESIILDSMFDELCEEINKEWDKLESPYKQLLIDNKDIPPIKGLELNSYPKEIVRISESRLEDHEAMKELFNE